MHKPQNKMYQELCMGIGESYCSEGGVGSEILPGGPWDQPHCAPSFSFRYRKDEQRAAEKQELFTLLLPIRIWLYGCLESFKH